MNCLSTDKQNSPLQVKMLWCGSFCLFALLYFFTVQAGACWQDSGAYQWRIINGDYTGELGLASAHPLFIAIGRLFMLISTGDITTMLNFSSGIAMSIALANLAVIASLLTNRRWIGFSAALMLSVTHTTWWLATITESYSWQLAVMTGELILFINLIFKPKWYSGAALFLLNGINLGIHNLALLPLPVYCMVLIFLAARKKIPLWTIPVSFTAYALGALPYISLIIDTAIKTGDIPGAIHSALFGKFASEVLNTKTRWHFMKANAGLTSLNFINFTLPLAAVGWWNMKRRLGSVLASSLGIITVIEFVFFLRYSVPDQFTFFLPSLLMTAIASSIGISVLADKSQKWRNMIVCGCMVSVVIPPAVYAAAPAVINFSGLTIKRERERPFRDEIRYWIIPWKNNEKSAEQFAAAALRQASPDGVIVCDSTSLYPLLVVRHRDGFAPGVLILNSEKLKSGSRQNPAFLSDILHERPLFTVLPSLNLLPPEMAGKVVISRSRGEVLYDVKGILDQSL